MTAYAAVLSLFHTLNNIKIHPRPPISLDPQQLQSLSQNLTFFQDFLERHPTQEDYDLESRIAAAAYAAEDVIENHIVDQIDHARSTSENISSVDLYGGLERVIQDMDLIKGDVMEIIQEEIMTPQHHPHLHSNSSGAPTSTWQSSAMPVFDDAIITDVLDKLTGQQSSLQIIPIVGMGGIGKTTFARYIYSNSLIVGHFDIRVWVTVSQEYSVSKILAQVLYQGNRESALKENELGERVHKMLIGRRYLIVMDDMWNIEALDKVRRFFPDYNDGSRIMITTRLSNLAFELSDSHIYTRMKFLDEDKSWGLLCETVFDKELGCPIELEKIGKEIARKCRGLPLSIAVVGGLLKKSNMTRAYWIYTSENLNSIINLENDEYVLQILGTSYKELPMHLKPCFLYMGVFPEDREIRLSWLVKFWVAEGILKPITDKSLEEVAKEYLKELSERNLILIPEFQWDGEARYCKMHDLLREVCLREAQKQKFFGVLRQQKYHLPQDINMERRICFNPENTVDKYPPESLHVVESALLTRSYLYTGQLCIRQASPSLRFRLLRVHSPVNKYSLLFTNYDTIFEQTNLRYLRFSYAIEPLRFHSFYSLLWNLQTLKVYYSSDVKLTFKIWEMPLLRHVTILMMFVLPDSPNGEHNLVLENLQTLSWIMNFKCSEEVVKRIPNLKKLKVKYNISELDDSEVMPNICLNNLDRLQKLESLNLNIGDNCDVEKIMRNSVSFPHSLKKLILSGTQLNWEEVTMRIGSLPLLQFLILDWDACVGDTWKTIEGQFCSLRCLKIKSCEELKYWETDSSYFPRLEILHLDGLTNLEEIPSSIGDIPTLKSIQLKYCSKSAEVSAKRIREEQKENGNEDLDIQLENERIREKQKENGNEDLDIQLENGYEEFKKYSEEGDQVVSDSYAGDEEDEEEGDQVVSDSYVEDEEIQIQHQDF
ncbi:hypothetical protein ACS0TY_000185 [Phlomoides rotata]